MIINSSRIGIVEEVRVEDMDSGIISNTEEEEVNGEERVREEMEEEEEEISG